MTTDFRRYGVFPGTAQQKVGFFLPDTFAMLPFISALEPLRAANRYSDKHLYSWHLFGEKNTPARANNALEQAVEDVLENATSLDMLIICGPHDPHHYNNDGVLKALRKISANGTRMGALDTGTYLLAKAKLIDTHRCTLHWENLPGFKEEFPRLNVSSELFEIDGKLDCVELMEANIEQPLSTQELASIIGISKRQLERLFRAHLQTTPTAYCQQTRLQAGQRLLEQTSMTVLEIAIACGFASTGHFSRRFRSYYGYSPRQSRARL